MILKSYKVQKNRLVDAWWTPPEAGESKTSRIICSYWLEKLISVPKGVNTLWVTIHNKPAKNRLCVRLVENIRHSDDDDARTVRVSIDDQPGTITLVWQWGQDFDDLGLTVGDVVYVGFEYE